MPFARTPFALRFAPLVVLAAMASGCASMAPKPAAAAAVAVVGP